MNVLNNTINRLEQLIREMPEKVKSIPVDELEKIPAPGKWSKKEIIGHLSDSAVNNIARFIRAQFETGPFNIISYNQDNWVRANNYGKADAGNIIKYWVSLNTQILEILRNIPEQKLAVICNMGNAAFRNGETEKSLLWLIEDYIVHMEYHLKQILGDKF